MIGLDTNILVRYFAKDDPKQTPLAVSLMKSLTPAEPGWVGFPVLIEVVFVMTRVYRVDRSRLTRILDTLLASRDIVVEQANIVRAALQFFRLGNADFPDCLISASARAAGCTKTVTFDRIAARDAAMQLLE